MITPDTIPLWFGIPAVIALWVTLIVVWFRGAAPDPYDELTGLDVLERTGSHPH